MIVKGCAPIRVVDLGLLAKQLTLSCLVGEVSTDLVAVFFGLEEGEDVQSGPDLFASKFTVFVLIGLFNYRGTGIFGGKDGRTVAHEHRRTACSNRRP